MKPIDLTAENFKSEVLESNKPVLVDFWAEWCMPCKMIAPIVEEIAKEYDGKLKVAKMDVDANKELSANLGIRSIPTLLVFKGGQVVDQLIGAVRKQILVDRLSRHLS